MGASRRLVHLLIVPYINFPQIKRHSTGEEWKGMGREQKSRGHLDGSLRADRKLSFKLWWSIAGARTVLAQSTGPRPLYSRAGRF